ncbi:hypothetical protein BDZ91DRAFT_449953 [Kalaharituber pfeilii]|nr:hypothetical protein BDZ91DRAFT_449953 [Kalaharituber pfeilii]
MPILGWAFEIISTFSLWALTRDFLIFFLFHFFPSSSFPSLGLGSFRNYGSALCLVGYHNVISHIIFSTNHEKFFFLYFFYSHFVFLFFILVHLLQRDGLSHLGYMIKLLRALTFLFLLVVSFFPSHISLTSLGFASSWYLRVVKLFSPPSLYVFCMSCYVIF